MQERFADFRAAYEAELDGNPAVQTLRDLAAEHGKVTLLFGPGTRRPTMPGCCRSSSSGAATAGNEPGIAVTVVP